MDKILGCGRSHCVYEVYAFKSKADFNTSKNSKF